MVDCLLVGATLISCVFVLRLLRNFYAGRPNPIQRWLSRFEVEPAFLGGFTWSGLILVSLLGLFFEMLMIRWLSSEIRIFAFFKNFVLIACFLGFGLGCFLCRRRINLAALAIPLLALVLAVDPPTHGARQLIMKLPIFVGTLSGVQIWGINSIQFSAGSAVLVSAALVVSALFFLLATFVFIPFGQFVGWYLENARRGVTAYTVNVLASLTGIGLYTVLCYWCQPPLVWFLTAGALFALVLRKMPRQAAAVAAVFVLCAAIVIPHEPSAITFWSPYQKLKLIPLPDAQNPQLYTLMTNDSWYQSIVNLSPAFVAAHPDSFQDVPIESNAYNLPYQFYPSPPSVLVLGAGMGNDLAGALRNGAGRVVAVEIDPLILQLGRQRHFEHPYQSPRVHPVLNDARAYLQNANERFDLIVFSLLDSHTTSSNYSNIRIDNYIYTQEALTAARRLLKPDGVFIVKFAVAAPWIAGRLENLLENVFGAKPLRLAAPDSVFSTGGQMFVTGSTERIAAGLQTPVIRDIMAHHPALNTEPATLTTDDWPYFYQRERGVPLLVLLLSTVLAILCRSMIASIAGDFRSMNWHFFFLGAGFMLLEAQIVSKMALLFGTTWMVNSLVISGLLLLIVAANCVTEFVRVPRWMAYSGMFVSLAIAWLIPPDKLFFASAWTRAAVATLVLCLPVFFAGLIFVRSFAEAAFSGKALGANLLGSLVGGLLESLSFWTGLRSLLLIAALLYLGSAIALRVRVKTPATMPDRALAVGD